MPVRPGGDLLSYIWKVLLDRRQFGVTITYHFLFVPLTASDCWHAVAGRC